MCENGVPSLRRDSVRFPLYPALPCPLSHAAALRLNRG